MKHFVRDEGEANFSFLISVVCFQVNRDCIVAPVTSTSMQSSRKKRKLRKFTQLSSVVEKISTRTNMYIKSALLRTREDGVRSVHMTQTEH